MKDLTGTNYKRVFISIEFNESTKDYLQKIESIIVANSEKGNFITKDNFHLTLKFIGEIKIESIDKIKKCIDEVALNYSNFNLCFDKLGEFPRGNKSIVWVGVTLNEILDKLHLDLDKSLDKIGVKKENKKFAPHITLGRQVILSEEFNNLAEKVNIDNISILVDKISLMESTRINGELKYIPIYVKKF